MLKHYKPTSAIKVNKILKLFYLTSSIASAPCMYVPHIQYYSLILFNIIEIHNLKKID